MSSRRDNPTARRQRQVRWGRRLRRLGLAWDNALEIARAGRLTAPYGAPFEVVHEERVYRLRHYASDPEAIDRIAAPLLLVPPLMVASEVYDISPEVSAVAYLTRAGVDVWLVDFGAPEREQGGMDRTLDDHIRAVSKAVDRVAAATGQPVHLAGYSQGGMFCYQAAALRRSANVASIVAMGSPVDLRRQLPLDENATERLAAGLRAMLAWPLARIEGLPGTFTSTGFKVLSARKEVVQIVDFIRNLHDRSALEKREAKRLFLGGDGFVAWPGPAFRSFVDDVIVGNRLASGGFVVDGRTVTLADITCPILYVVGSRDAIGRPGSVRGIRHAAPHATAMYELSVKSGHFGLVVGSTALGVTWPSVAAWIKHVAGDGALPDGAVDARSGTLGDATYAGGYDDDDDVGDANEDSPLEFAKHIAEKAASVAADQISALADDLGHYVDQVRWQLPRVRKLTEMRDDTLVSLARSLAEQAATIGDRTFFLWRGRAFSFADANRRVDAVVRGLIACGVIPGQRVGVVMQSRPSQLSAVCALNRLGAIAVLLGPDVGDDALRSALDALAPPAGSAQFVIADPDSAARIRTHTAATVLVLGGVGEQGDFPPGFDRSPRTIPAGAIDMEAIDPDAVMLPHTFQPDPGRAGDLAMIFVSATGHGSIRARHITNRRWAFSALGAAAAATLTARDTVYCCLPLHHPSGLLVAAGSALISGARLALASRFEAKTFWDEVRRYGVSVVFYAGEMCRLLVEAAPVSGETNNPVRLFAGSGMRPDVWRRVVQRFGPVGVLEMYASTEANAVLANAAGKKVGSVGRPLPGSNEVAIAAWDLEANQLTRDSRGRAAYARIDEPGMLISRLPRASAGVGDSGLGAGVSATASTRPAAMGDSDRVVNDVFEPGDRWLITGDLMTVDSEGDHWFVDHAPQMVKTHWAPVASRRIEDALYASGAVTLCIALPRRTGAHDVPIAAIQVRGALDLDAVSAAVRTLPEYARPRQLYVVDHLPMTAGFRVIKRGVEALDGPADYTWDARAEHYVHAANDMAATA